MSTEPTSLTDTAAYRQACLEYALERPEAVADGSFRHDPRLDHVWAVTPAQAGSYLEAIGPGAFARIAGGPSSPFLEDPVMARYAFTVSEIERRFGKPPAPRGLDWRGASLTRWLAGLDVLEIGGGFGGLAALLAHRVRSYQIVDLPEVGMLQRTWLRSQNLLHAPRELNVRCVSNTDQTGRDSDLLISTYAFSELTAATQERYAELYLRRAARGYLICNFTTGSLGAEEYGRLVGRPVIAWEPESPQTHPDNQILAWGT